MSSSLQAAAAPPWYRQRWPWLLISGPAVAVIGCAVTIWLAYQTPDPPAHDRVIRNATEKARP
jgi:hypothetical protein